MKIRYMGREIEFSEAYRPDTIMVDGKAYSMTLYAERHGGKNWSTSASGNLLHYEADDGAGITIPQKRFQMTDDEWKALHAMKRSGLA